MHGAVLGAAVHAGTGLFLRGFRLYGLGWAALDWSENLFIDVGAPSNHMLGLMNFILHLK